MTATAYSLAVDLLARVVAYFETAAVALPEIRYVAPGDSNTIAYDESSLVVNLDWLGWGQPGVDRTASPQWPMVTRYGQWAVTILRTAVVQNEDGSFPDPTAIQADAAVSMTDAQTLQQALIQIRQDCQTAGGWVSPAVPVAAGRINAVGPQGGLIATVGTMQAGMVD